ncbi:hypothetical protein [Aeromonas phage AS-sw]|uniref:Uncharacterized protein n=1 Tax=Aeromonas phage AS-sw TaxID=2026113 RepID=A0A291LFG9_9CAUD|nr:goF mRNA metabolism modulator [Aeromonas phage AS-sw]ATI18091.1 hypothetical protein [Aeromonas phage AS-sw]
MKVRFVSEKAMNEYGEKDRHNKLVVERFGMNPFEVDTDPDCAWWDYLDENGDIEFVFPRFEHHYFLTNV